MKYKHLDEDGKIGIGVAMKPKVSEHDNMNLIKNFLEVKGWFVIRLNAGAIKVADKRGSRMIRLARRGMPDLLAFKDTKNGMRVIFVEVKAEGGVVSDTQDLMMRELEGYGAQCLVAYSLEDVEGVL